MDWLESLTNATVGLMVSYAATLLVLGFSPADSAWVTAMFFGLSFARAWRIRAAFRRWGK